jgi:hypothetical protein
MDRSRESPLNPTESRFAHRLNESFATHSPQKRTNSGQSRDVRFVPIVLQKSKVAGLGIFHENTTRELIADSYTFNRVTEVACAFDVER